MSSLERVTQIALERTRDAAHFGEQVQIAAVLVREAGVPLDRIFVGTRTLHPQTFAYAVVWTAEGGYREVHFPHARMVDTLSDDSPVRRLVMEGLPVFRARIAVDGDQGLRDLVELARQGYSDVAAWPLRWNGRVAGAITYTTRLPAGFSDEHVRLLEAVHLVLEARLGNIANRETLGALLRAYLGAGSAERVMLGEVKRGDGQTIRAALWFSDLRGFSTISETRSGDDVLAFLNEAFEIQCAAIQSEGGQVLRFIGDGLLAIFQVDPVGETASCERALRAALKVREALKPCNESRQQKGLPRIGIGIALHLGDVMYGNVGSPDRLDFSVIGPAVNRAARIEDACARLGRDILVSAEFAALAPGDLTLVARVEFKGIDGLHEVFAPTDKGAGD
jgi:adenylate cyclase